MPIPARKGLNEKNNFSIRDVSKPITAKFLE